MLMVATRDIDLQNAHGEGAEPFHHLSSSPPGLVSMFEKLEVGPLALPTGVEILTRGFRSRGDEDNEKAEALARQCKCIPLRLKLAAGVLSGGRADFKVG